MRPWWQDLLINTGGAAVGAVIAVGVTAVAGKTAGLFDQAQEFRLRRFVKILAGSSLSVFAGLSAVIGAVAGIISLLESAHR